MDGALRAARWRGGSDAGASRGHAARVRRRRAAAVVRRRHDLVEAHGWHRRRWGGIRCERDPFHLPAVDVVRGKVEPLAGGIDARKRRARPHVRQHDGWAGGSGVRIDLRSHYVQDAGPIGRPHQVAPIRAPVRREIQCPVACHLVHHPAVRIDYDDVVPALRPAACGDPAPVGRNRWVGPVGTGGGRHERLHRSVPEIDPRQSVGSAAFGHRDNPCPIGTG